MKKRAEWFLPVEWMRGRDEAFRKLFAFDFWLETFDEGADEVPAFFDLRWGANPDFMDVEESLADLVESTVLNDLNEDSTPENEFGSDPDERPFRRGYADMIENVMRFVEEQILERADQGELLDGSALRDLARIEVIRMWQKDRTEA